MKKLRGFSNYRFTKEGNVFYWKNKSLFPFKHFKGISTGGYCKVNLTNDKGQRATQYLHRIIAQLFLKNPKNKPCVNHLDGDKENNNYENLEWVTRSENEKHAYKIGLKNANGRAAKLTKEQVIEIRKRLVFEKVGILAKIFNVNQSTISRIKMGDNWKWV